MKWKNKGHEFDELGNTFIKNNTLLLIGTKSENDRLKKHLSFIGVSIETIDIPNLVHKSKKIFQMIKMIINRVVIVDLYMRLFLFNIKSKKFILKQYDETKIKNRTIIINFGNVRGLLGRLMANKVINDFIKYNNSIKHLSNIFTEREFMKYGYVSIFAVYTKNKIYSKHNGIIVTIHCNLNCKYCQNFTPYIQRPFHMELENLKKDADIFFNVVDFVGWINLSGGEPLMYPDFYQIIEYIYENYKDKIDLITFSTNGSIVPSDDLCKLLKRAKIRVLVDDYTKAVPRLKSSMKSLINKLNEFCIDYIYVIDKEASFINMFPSTAPHTQSDEEMAMYYDRCQYGHHAQPITDGKVASCAYSAYSQMAGVFNECPDDYYDIANFDNSVLKRREYIEFRLGYSNKGYTNLCRHCNGSPNINKQTSIAGLQAEGRLEYEFADCKE
jgi:hypothetical protein